MVDPAGDDVVGHLAVHRGRVVVEVARAVRQRIDARDVAPDGMDAVLRDDVVRKRVAQELGVRGADGQARIEIRVHPGRQRVVDRDEDAVGPAEVAEIAVPCLRSRHGVDEHLPALFFQPRVVGEEERPVVAVVEPGDHDGAAGRAAELVPVERRLGIDLQRAVGERHLPHEEVARIERVVAEVLEHRAVQHVASRLRRDRDDAGAAPELGREDPGQHLELPDLFHRRRDDHGVERVLVVVDPVDQPGVRVGLMPQRVEVRRAARVEGAGARQVLAGLPGGDPRCQVDQRREVPAVQRKLLDRALLDDGADFRRIGAQQRRLRRDGRGFFDAPDLQRDVHARALIDLEDHAAADPFLEPRHVDFDDIGAGCQERRGVAPGVVGHVRVRRPFAHLADGDGGARHDAVGVADRADNRARSDLRADGRGPGQRHQRHQGQCEDPSRRHSSLLPHPRIEVPLPRPTSRSLPPPAAEVKVGGCGVGGCGDQGGSGDQIRPLFNTEQRRNGETECFLAFEISCFLRSSVAPFLRVEATFDEPSLRHLRLLPSRIWRTFGEIVIAAAGVR